MHMGTHYSGLHSCADMTFFIQKALGPSLGILMQCLFEGIIIPKVVAMEEFQTSYNGFLNFLGYDVWSRSFC